MLTGTMMKEAAVNFVAIRQARAYVEDILSIVMAAIRKHKFECTEAIGGRVNVPTPTGLLIYSYRREGELWITSMAGNRDRAVHSRNPHAHIDEFVYFQKEWFLNWCAGGGSGESIQTVDQLPLGVLPNLIFYDLAACLAPLTTIVPELETNLARLANFDKK